MTESFGQNSALNSAVKPLGLLNPKSTGGGVPPPVRFFG